MVDRTRQKNKNEIEDMSDTKIQRDLTDTYRTLCPPPVE
jgi:hypothetical protein